MATKSKFEIEENVSPKLVLATPEDVQREIDAEIAAHDQVQKDREEAHAARLAALTLQKAELEIAAEKEREASVPGRLEAVLASMAEAKQGDVAEAAEIAEDADQEAILRQRAAPYLAAAEETEKALDAWERLYLEKFETLDRADRDSYLQGMPSSTNVAQNTSVNLVRRLQAGLESGLTLYHNARETQERTRRELESLITFGRLRLGSYEILREFNQIVHELGMINSDTIDTLNVHASSVTKNLEIITALKAEVAGTAQPPILFTSKSQEMESVKRAEVLTRRGNESGRPSRALVD